MKAGKLTIYGYGGCGTCRRAVAFLTEYGIPFEERPIDKDPPSPVELQRMVDAVGDVRRLFNSSGGAYRSLNLKERLGLLTHPQQLDLLAGNGMLIRRPFVLGEGVALLGFREDEWRRVLL